MRVAPRGGWLLAGAAASFALVVLHLAVIVVGAPAYAYFLAGQQMVDLAEARSLAPTVVTGALVFVFAVFGLYGLAGAGCMELPATRVLVAAIGCVYTLRGLLIVPGGGDGPLPGSARPCADLRGDLAGDRRDPPDWGGAPLARPGAGRPGRGGAMTEA